MKDVIKSDGYKGQYKTMNGRRVKVDRQKRRNNMSGYYALAIVLGAVILLVLCMTWVFNYDVENIKINGVTLYTNEQILVVGGVADGGNLIRTDTDLIEERLTQNLVYIDKAEVKKKYPSGLEINVTEAVKAADIEYKGQYYVLSESGKLLECGNTERNENIALVKGIELKSLNPGEKLQAADVMKTKILNQLIELTYEMNFENITEIDLSYRTDIILKYDDRITIYIGSSVDMDYKLKYIKTVIDERLSDNYRGTLRYNGVNSGISAIPESENSRADTTESSQDSSSEAETSDSQQG